MKYAMMIAFLMLPSCVVMTKKQLQIRMNIARTLGYIECNSGKPLDEFFKDLKEVK